MSPTRDDARLLVPGVRLVEELGRGARSVVHRAERDGRQYALKALTTTGGPDEDVAFAREAALLASLRHPGLVRIHEVGRAGGRPYLIMDLVAGRPLTRVLIGKRLDDARVAATGAQVAAALAVAHRAGLVHRDVKPDNILIEADGRARLIDFGLAARTGVRLDDVAVGTFVYSAPEQTGALHRPVDGRADLYALGAVLFECVAGEPPFRADDTGELVRLHLSAPVPDLRGLRPNIAPALAAVITRLLAKDPDDRYARAEDVHRDLARVAAGDRDFPLTSHAPVQGGASSGPLVGRAAELARLRSCWDGALAGRGGTVLVEGPAGVGKSRLAEELAAGAAGHPVLRGTARPEEQVPLAPLRDAVERYVREVATLSGPERAHAVTVVGRAAGSAAGLLVGLAPGLADLIPVPDAGSDPGGDGDPFAPGGVDEDRFAEVVTRFLTGLADGHGGALLCLEDAPWWDEATRRVIQRLAGALPDSHLLLLATARDPVAGSPAVDLLGPVRAVRLRVGPLAGPEVAALVADQLGGASVPEPLVARLASRSGGNPLAVREYVRAALDAGLILPSWGTWVLDQAGLDELALPGDVIDLMLRRVDELSPSARELLVVAAAIGSRFPPELLNTVTARMNGDRPDAGRLNGHRPDAAGSVRDVAGSVRDVAGSADVSAALAEAVQHRLIEPTGGRYAFLHERIRQALVDRLDPPAARGLHQHIAEAMEDAEGLDTAAVYAIAGHYRRGDGSPDQVFRAASAAGSRALADYAAAQAFTFLDRAVTAAAEADIDPGPDVYAAFGAAANRIGAYEVARQQLGRALAGTSEPLRRARLYVALAATHHLQWDGEHAMDTARQGLAELGHRVPRGTGPLFVTSLARAASAGVLGRLPGRLRLAEGERRERYRIQAALTGVMTQSASLAMRFSEIGALSMLTGATVVRIGPGPEYAMKLASNAIVSASMGRPARAEKLVAAGLAEAERLGDASLIATVHFMRALLRDVLPPMTATSGREIKSMLDDHGQWLLAADYLSMVGSLGLIELQRGHVDEAARWYERARRRDGGGNSLGNPYMSLGPSIAAMRGQAAQAVTELRELRAFVATTPDNVGARLTTALTAIRVAFEQGELGAPFEEAITEFTSLRSRPTQVYTPQRGFWMYQAFGRLAQAAGASPAARDDRLAPEGRDHRLAAAARAVRDLRDAAKGPVLSAYATVAEAWLELLTGRPDRALRRLADLDAATEGYNAPLVDYEVARVRARALTAVGRGDDALRHARAALGMALEHGWRTRARWVRAEFDLAPTVGTAQRSIPRSGPGWGGPTGADWGGPTAADAPQPGPGPGPANASPGRAASASESRRPGQVGPARGDTSGVFGMDGLYARRLHALHQVSLAAAEILDPRQLCRVALDETVRIFGAERAFLFLLSADGDELEPYLGRDSHDQDLRTLTGYGSTLVERVRSTGEELVVTGSEEGEALGSRSALVHGLRSIMVAPVRFKGRLVGVIYLDSRAARGIFTPDDVEILNAITNQVAVAFETARAAQLEMDVRAAQRERDLAEKLRVAMIEISGTLDPDEVIQRMIDMIARSVPVDGWLLLRRGDDGPVTAVGAGGELPVADGADPVVGRLIGSDEPQGGSDAAADLAPLGGMLGGSGHAWLALPLLLRGEHRGVLLVSAAQARPYTDGEARIAAALAGQGMAAYDNALLFRQVGELAVRDGLTGLFNRRHFYDLARPWLDPRQRQGPVATVMVDIDHFKVINDTYGHGTGDDVIRAVAGRLAGCLRDSDVICRYGGEEFAVLLTETSAEQAETVARRLHAAIGDTPVEVGAGPLDVTVSVGVTTPSVGRDDLHVLLDSADQALYAAKRAGRNRVMTAPVRDGVAV